MRIFIWSVWIWLLATVFGVFLAQAVAQVTVGSSATGARVPGTLKVGSSTAINSKAILEVVSTTKGARSCPLMTTTQRDAITSPVEGLCVYNTTTHAVNIYNGTSWGSVGGGGGGGALVWTAAAANAPVDTEENNNKVFLYEAAQTQTLYTVIRVPTSYSTGGQINLKVPYYSPDTSGTVLLSCTATLIRLTTDAITSTTNQRTSTNTATTLTTTNLSRSHTCDITSSTGTINSVAVSAGDLILVALFRGTDSATADVRALVYGAEATFQ